MPMRLLRNTPKTLTWIRCAPSRTASLLCSCASRRFARRELRSHAPVDDVGIRRLKFKVGDKEVKNFRMIERHYHGNKLIKSYDFNVSVAAHNLVSQPL